MSTGAPPTIGGQEGHDAKTAAGRCCDALYAAYTAKHEIAPMRKAKDAALMLPLVRAYGEGRVLMLVGWAFGKAYHLFANSGQDVAAFVRVAPQINVTDDAPALSRKTLNNLAAAAAAMGRRTSKVPRLLLPDSTKKEDS